MPEKFKDILATIVAVILIVVFGLVFIVFTSGMVMLALDRVLEMF